MLQESHGLRTCSPGFNLSLSSRTLHSSGLFSHFLPLSASRIISQCLLFIGCKVSRGYPALFHSQVPAAAPALLTRASPSQWYDGVDSLGVILIFSTCTFTRAVSQKAKHLEISWVADALGKMMPVRQGSWQGDRRPSGSRKSGSRVYQLLLVFLKY